MSYTEQQLREAMKKHHPGNEGDCVCAWDIGANPSQVFDADHLIDVLKENAERERLYQPRNEISDRWSPR